MRPSGDRLMGRATHSPTVLSLLILCVLAFAPTVLANGGTVRLSNEPAGPYQVSAFTSPSPLRTGTVDVSVLVQRLGTGEQVPDVQVTVTVEPAGGQGDRRSYQATHEQATNKLYYAANVQIPAEGRWRISIDVVGQSGAGSAAFEVEATPAGLLDNPLLLIGLLAAPVAGLLLLIGVRMPRRNQVE